MAVQPMDAQLFVAGRRKPARLRRAAAALAAMGPADGSLRRHLLAGSISLAAVWTLAGGYLLLAPRTWTSTFVFVLPGAGTTSAMNLPAIGQASSGSPPAFSSPDISPTENYRRMLMGHRAIAAAAERTDEISRLFPIPRVDLMDQTKLIQVKETGQTAEQARLRAEALRDAFQEMLDTLRSDEIAVRDRSSRAVLAGYRSRVTDARRRLIEHEARSGLATIEQYAGIVAAVDRLRQQQQEAEARLAVARASQGELTRLLGVTAAEANQAMVLRADPTVQPLLEQMGKEDTELATLSGIRGAGSPRLLELQAERASVQSRVQARISELTGVRRDPAKARDLSIRDERARLFERLLGQAAETEAAAALAARLREQMEQERARVMDLAPAASTLDELAHDVQVAEAVFASALARGDTSKADLYVSYPLLQTLEEPDLPERPTSPSRLLTAAGTLAATLLIAMILVLAWLRTTLLTLMLERTAGPQRRKSGSSPERSAQHGSSMP